MKAQVLLPKIFNFSFTYKTKKEKLTPGDIVEVPFGKEKVIGVVWPSESFTSKDIKIKNFRQQYLHFHILIVVEFFFFKNELVFYQQLMLLL